MRVEVWVTLLHMYCRRASQLVLIIVLAAILIIVLALRLVAAVVLVYLATAFAILGVAVPAYM